MEVPDEDFQAQCMDLAAEVLEEAGYERYEVASYAKPGHRCRHRGEALSPKEGMLSHSDAWSGEGLSSP